MRVAFIVDKFPNISETFILDEIVGIIERGVDVDVYAFRRGEAADIHPAYTKFRLDKRTLYCSVASGNRVLRLLGAAVATVNMLCRNPFAFFASALTRKRGVRTRSFVSLARTFVNAGRTYDIIHAHFGPNGIRAEVLRRANVLQSPLVTTFHGYDVTSFITDNGSAVYADLAQSGERFIAVSHSVARALQTIGMPTSRTQILPLGVDPHNFTPKAPVLSSTPVRILSVGRFVEKKGFEFGIRAVAQAHCTCPEIVYDIIGDGELRLQLETLVAALGAESYVRLHGYKNQIEVGAMMARADIMLVPSVTAMSGDQEGLPVVVKEAMACALPVVASHHAGIPEIVEHGVTGLLADERDYRRLAQHIVELARDGRQRAALGAAGRNMIEARFDNGHLIDGLVDLYKNVIAGRAAIATVR